MNFMLLDGPITETMGTIRAFLGNLVTAIGPSVGRGARDTSQTMVFFSIVSLLIVMLTFWKHVMNENLKRKGSERIEGFMASMEFLGMRLLLVPLIIFGGAIPMVFYQITPSAFASTGSVANRVAETGDLLIDKMSSFYGLYVSGEIGTLLDPSTAASPGLTDSDKANLTSIQSGWKSADASYKAAKGAVDELQKKKALYKMGGGDNPMGWNASDESSLQSAQRKLPQAEAAFNKVNGALSSAQSSLMPKIRYAHDKAELDALRTKQKELERPLNVHGREGAGAGAYRETALADVQGQIERLETRVATGKDPVDANAGFWTKLGAVFMAILEILSDFRFWLCILPAFLGMIAGAIVCLKEALGLIQFGAKLEIMKNLTLSLAAALGPLFMLGFLFEKTEQFAWKFVTLMFSMFFSYLAVSWVCGVALGPGFSVLQPVFDSLTGLSLSQDLMKYGHQPSMELFMASLKIGFKGLGVGMITAFILDVVKSSISVGQSLFSGTFSAS